MKRLSFLCALALASCVHVTPEVRVPATLALFESPTWHTMSAQHHVVVTVQLAGGQHETRNLRGLVAVGQPDKLRLRALGPAGITLFDLLVIGGTQPVIISAIRGPGDGASGQALSEVITSLAADLACAYNLQPGPPERHAVVEGDAVVVDEPGRRIRLSHYSGTPATWRRAEIKTPKYLVEVEVNEVVIDPAFEPAVFNPTPTSGLDPAGAGH
jgi:hypothetical protein